ncbi:MAG: DUF4435 domain-containing protein [Rikenellaceae bacterium]|jgi:hypothetical protein|nr:DUF4435 domain-containing protein [Rikenellaceae bacterium]
MPLADHTRLVKVYVEGYEDVAFWRGIFDGYESDEVSFEISVPPRHDLAKGKKVLFDMLENSSPRILLCADSDFDYLFAESTPQSKMLLEAPYMFHTYAYSTENFLCYAPSLHNVCVKATKNDTRIFDFEQFLAGYSRTIYPLFLWYALSAQRKAESFFTLLDFKSSVKLNYLEIADCGAETLSWLGRHVARRLESLQHRHPEMEAQISRFAAQVEQRGLHPDNVYMFMQGHTLMDNVVMVLLHAVCDQLMMLTNNRIAHSTKQGTALRNEQSNYNNSLRNVRDILLDNENYRESFLYKKLKKDIDDYMSELMRSKV